MRQGHEGIVELVDGTPKGEKAANIEAKQLQGLAENNQLTAAQQTHVSNIVDQILASTTTGQKGISVEDKIGDRGDGDRGNNTNKKEGIWNVVTPRKSPTKNEVTAGQKNLSVRRKDTSIVPSPNAFEILATEDGVGLNATSLIADAMNKQIVPCNSNEKAHQGSGNLAENLMLDKMPQRRTW